MARSRGRLSSLCCRTYNNICEIWSLILNVPLFLRSSFRKAYNR